LKKKIRETKDPLEKSLLANSGWRGEEEMEKTVESIKNRHTAFLQEMDDRHEKLLAENNQRREMRRASMRLASMNTSVGNVEPVKVQSPNQPKVVRELFPADPRPHEQNSMPNVQVQHPVHPTPHVSYTQPSPIQHTVQSMQRPVPPFSQSVPQLNQNPIPHLVQPTQRPIPNVPQFVPQLSQNPIPHMAQPTQQPVQNVPQPFQQQSLSNHSAKGTVKEPELIDVDADVEILSFKRIPEKVQMPVGGQKEEQVIPMEVEIVTGQPLVEVMPVAQPSAHVVSGIQGFFTSTAGKGCSEGGMEEFSQIIGSLADAYRRLDIFVKSKK